ncbi:MAG: hypothetical protein IJW55_08340 [Clostridia bacterium]|nr:hypothetical protein [Clostridia bacterium]
MTIHEMIHSEKEIKVTLEKKLILDKELSYGPMCLQGGETDGKYGYFIMNENGATAEVRSVIHKVDLDTWQVVDIKRDCYFCHANDVAYDSVNHRLLVSHCNVDPHVISVVDPDTLMITNTLRIPVAHYALAYNATRNQYVGGKSRCFDISIMDKDFNELCVIEGEDGFVKQGFACDDKSIYCFHSSIRNNHIWIYDWNGNFIRRVKVPMVGEAEHLFRRGDHFIAGFNGTEDKTGVIYEMFFSIDEK